MPGFKISCDYCGEKSPIKSIEQYKDMLNPKSDAKFTLSKTGLRCRKCGNKVEEKVGEIKVITVVDTPAILEPNKVVKPDESN